MCSVHLAGHRRHQNLPFEAKLIEDDPFWLHEPLTVSDVMRIERALADGSVEGAEADRLRVICEQQQREFAEKLRPALASSLPKLDVSSVVADNWRIVKESVSAAVLNPVVEAVRPTLQSQVSHALAALKPQLDLASLSAGALIDSRPAHTEDVACRQLDVLRQLCDRIDTLTAATIDGERRAEARHEELKRMTRRQSSIIISVTVLAALLGAAAGDLLQMILR